MKMKSNLDEAPFDRVLLFIFDSGLLHSGVKVKHQSYKLYRGLRQPIETSIHYEPVDIHATYDSEAYFPEKPIGWCELPDVEVEP